MQHSRSLALSSIAIMTLLLGACGKPAPEPAAADAKPADGFPGMEADLQRTIKEQPSFYIFKTAADIDKDTHGLTWEDGSDLPSFADPAAKKGGTLTIHATDFPGTLRSFGPDSNAHFRSYLLDYVSLGIVRVYAGIPGRIGPELASSGWIPTRAGRTASPSRPMTLSSAGICFAARSLTTHGSTTTSSRRLRPLQFTMRTRFR
jgi:hypothetical protein